MAEVAVVVAAVGLVREAEVCSTVAWVASLMDLAVDENVAVVGDARTLLVEVVAAEPLLGEEDSRLVAADGAGLDNLNGEDSVGVEVGGERAWEAASLVPQDRLK